MVKKTILFISYFYPPYESVGVKRISYWAENIQERGFDSFVITAIKPEEENERLIYVPPSDKAGFLSTVIKDKGLHWLEPLKRKLAEYERKKFDYILITGGPFMQMLITKFLKSHFDAEVILDFRDPFYANPRFKSSKIKDAVKLYFQNKFLKFTDRVITVNEECKKLIDHPDIDLIDNGFDERVLEKVKRKRKEPGSRYIISATGRVDHDFEMKYFFDALKSFPDTDFNYIGKNYFSAYEGSYNHYGFMPYKQALEFISASDLCVLFTGGMAFESSTKIFDYLALNKNILIITQGDVRRGSLHEITKDYPNVFWAENNTGAISSAIQEAKEHKPIEYDISRFSRAGGLNKLIKILSR